MINYSNYKELFCFGFSFSLDKARLLTTSTGAKRLVRTAFKKRIADDQYKINSEKEAVRKLMKHNHKEEYSHLLAKISRYCNIKQQEEIENVEPINVPEYIFNANIIRFFEDNGLSFDNIEILPMNEEEGNEYYKLFPN